MSEYLVVWVAARLDYQQGKAAAAPGSQTLRGPKGPRFANCKTANFVWQYAPLKYNYILNVRALRFFLHF